MEQEPQPKYQITQLTEADLDGATLMRLQSWVDTYVNDDLGITKEWIEERNSGQMTQEKRDARKEYLKDPNYAGWVAKDSQGLVIGSTTPYIDKQGRQHVGSLYVSKEWQGKGVGAALMQKVISWLDPTKPIELSVATYNERAQSFYRQWGFEEVPGSESLFVDKIPEVKMIRKAKVDEV